MPQAAGQVLMELMFRADAAAQKWSSVQVLLIKGVEVLDDLYGFWLFREAGFKVFILDCGEWPF